MTLQNKETVSQEKAAKWAAASAMNLVVLIIELVPPFLIALAAISFVSCVYMTVKTLSKN
ncbi:hypothetical protein [Pseudoalteromonas galatheae]|uniref:hypothetical protein n=1 Tax=Pseudoalteromonas galatheae TaxID=579562 RepID=UPI0030CEC5C8